MSLIAQQSLPAHDSLINKIAITQQPSKHFYLVTTHMTFSLLLCTSLEKKKNSLPFLFVKNNNILS